MKAPERILKIINHEEPDRVSAFESAFTNNTIMRHYGIDPDKERGYKAYYEFSRRVGIDLVLSITSLFPRKFLKDKSTFIDEYGRIMKYEPTEDGTAILAYHGGNFKSFEDYESFKQPDPNLKARMDNFLLGRKIQKELNNEVFSIPATGSLMECT